MKGRSLRRCTDTDTRRTAPSRVVAAIHHDFVSKISSPENATAERTACPLPMTTLHDLALTCRLVSASLALCLASCAVPPANDDLPAYDDKSAGNRGDAAPPADLSLGAAPSGQPPESSAGSGASGPSDGGGALAPCPPGAATLPWLCDGFEAVALDAAWSPKIQGGTVGRRSGGATGAGSLGAGFVTLPGGHGQAALSYAPKGNAAGAGAGVRFAVRVPKGSYPPRLGIGALRGAGAAAFVLELDAGVHVVVRDTVGMGALVSVGDLAFDAWTTVSIELDVASKTVTATMPGATRTLSLDPTRASAAVEAIEVGLSYDGGADPSESIMLGFDDVVIGRGLASSPSPSP